MTLNTISPAGACTTAFSPTRLPSKAKPKGAKKKTVSEPLTSENLSNTLWETLNQLRLGEIKATYANAIATQSREICRIKKMQLDAIKLMGKPTKADLKKLSM